MKTLSIDIESYSSENLAKSGVYRYADSPDFEVLLFGYSADGAPVKVVDLTAGETIPDDVRSALTDPAVTKWAFNAQFERVCLSRYLGYPTGKFLDPSSWHCTMVWAATLGLPLSLEGVGAVLGLEKQKLKEGKDLIRYFCTPSKARDGSLIRHYPTDAPEKWSLFKAYNLRDVETEMSIQHKLSKFPVTESEWRNYTLDQQINDRGIMLDRTLVTQAISCDERFKRTHMEQARSVTGLDNPNSPVQLKAWLAEKGVEADSLSKSAVAEMLEKADGEVELALSLRQELAKSSVKKYTAMQTVVGSDSRARGLIQFYGANRTGRYAGRLIQVQNLPQNHLPDLKEARTLIRSGNFDAVEMLYDSVPLVLSELIRTAFVPKPGCRFYVADFSAIEARVIAWIAGEHWRQEVFANGGDIYCASASQMFHVPVEKHSVNGHLRQKGKVKNTLQNLTVILMNDPLLKPLVFNQLLDGMEIKGDVPWRHPSKFWRDADDAQLISYVDSHYGTFSARNYDIAVAKVTDDRSYHPIREFIDNLPEWDGIKRVDTLLVDYLGANDNEYVRAVTRKTLCAAIKRVLYPGCKFDSMLVLNGPQGVGKSTLIAKLAGEWFSDSLNLGDTKDKTAAEKLQGYWILEIGELAGLKKAEVETLRSFLSRQNDIYRAAFGKRATPHLRQCVFFGTTNAESGYLRDTTGNRRFWPVKTPGTGKKHSWDLTPELICQIWAEALVYVKQGEKLYLSAELETLSKAEQREAMESDEREGLVRLYLDTLLPADWDRMDIFERRNFLTGSDFGDTVKTGTVKRTHVSNMEIWCECFGKERANIRRTDSNELTAILARLGWKRLDSKMRIPLYGPQYIFVPKECSR